MNITDGNTDLPAISSPQSQDSDLLQRRPITRKISRRKIKSAGAGVRLRKDISGTPAGRRSRPHTPLLRWKFDEDVDVSNGCDAEEECLGRKCHLKTRAPFSARKLAAGIWRLQLPAVPADGENLGFQGGAGHAGTPFYSHRHSKTQDSQVSESLESPRSVSGPRNGTFRKVEPSFHFPSTAMEGATKWDPIRWKPAEGGTKHIHGPHQKAHTSSMVSVLEEELDQARARVQELETEQQLYKKKIEQFLKKVSEERALWRSREHEKIRTILDDLKVELTRERKTRQRAEMVNAKLVNELADAKVTAKRYMQEYEKERKTRELIEEVCDELAKEIGEDKAEVEVLKRESAKLHEEVDEERRMLQMAEVWREERVQMKLIDAKVTLEEKYSQMNSLIADLESLLCSKGINNPDMDGIKKFAAAVNVHNIQEFTYEPPNPDDIFSIFEDQMVTEENNSQRHHHHHHTKAYTNQSDGYGGEDGGSEWETVSNVSRSGAGSTPATDISEVCSTPAQPTKKGSSMSRRRCPNGGRHANGSMTMMSPNREWSKEDDVSATYSGDSGNHHVNRGMKGCIEWPRNSTQKNSLKSKLLEAKMESQKIQLRHVLKQKI